MRGRKSIFISFLCFPTALLLGCRHVENLATDETTSGNGTGIATWDSSGDAGADAGDAAWDAPKNVVLFIGDGMGQSHIAAAGMYENGESGTLYFESFPVHGLVNNASANALITDSAAAATAMACGRKVNNSVLALEIPGDAHELPSLVDFYKHRGKSTGLVTTTYITHATPSAFAAHAANRSNTADIAWHYLNSGRPELMFGGGGFGLTDEAAMDAGYTVYPSLEGYDPDAYVDGTTFVAGLFGVGYYPYEASGELDRPHLYETGPAAVETLLNDPDGFFVMIEGGMIDQAAHANRLDLVVGEMLAFEQTVQAVVDLVDIEETLVIVTADHATGALEILENNGMGLLPTITWGTTVHNAGAVDLFAVGKGADDIARRFEAGDGYLDNTEIFDFLTQPEL